MLLRILGEKQSQSMIDGRRPVIFELLHPKSAYQNIIVSC